MAEIQSDWSRIPGDLLVSIAKLLLARIDILRLRAVCSSFRATLPLPPILYPFPDSILTSDGFLKGPNPKENVVYTLMASTVYAIEPLDKVPNIQDEKTPQTWVIRVQEPNPGRVVIIDPITGSESKKLSDQLPKPLNFLDYRVTEITKSYQLVSNVGTLIVAKLIFSLSPDENDDEFAVMATCRGCQTLGFWRNLDKKWSKIDIQLKSPEFLEDISYHNDKFYALSSKGRTVIVDSKTLVVTQVAELQLSRKLSILYLVGSINDLFLIKQLKDYTDCNYKYYVEVFKLNEEKGEWVRVVDGLGLEDKVLFVGEISCPYSVLVKELSGCKGGCIYYVGNTSYENACRGEVTWIWDFKDGVSGHLSDFPGYLNLFRPPAWLKSSLPEEKSILHPLVERMAKRMADGCMYIQLLTLETGQSSQPVLLWRNREEALEFIVRDKSQG